MFLRFRSALPLALARTFSLLVRSFYAPCRQGLFFSRCLKRLMVTIGSRKVWCGLCQILFRHKGKEDFTQSVLNTEAIRKQRFTFAERKEYVFRWQNVNKSIL